MTDILSINKSNAAVVLIAILIVIPFILGIPLYEYVTKLPIVLIVTVCNCLLVLVSDIVNVVGVLVGIPVCLVANDTIIS